MSKKYSFMQVSEPTERQLAELMHEVAVEAKNKADAAQIIFKSELHNQVLAAKERLKKMQDGL